MQPQNPNPIQPQLDQDAVNLAKAIRQNESGGNFQARGKSGEYGAYQYRPDTWSSYSQKHLGRPVALEQATPEEQNEVTYKQIKEWKDQGYNVGQIASMWNSGKPNAYLDPKYKGKNSYGAEYDVPKYAETVAKTYQALKAGQDAPGIAGPSTVTANVQQPEEKGPGVVQGMIQTVARPLLKTIASGDALYESVKGLGKAVFGKDTTANKQEVDRITTEGKDFGYFGKVTPIGAGFDVTKGVSENKDALKDAVGTGLEASTFIAPVGAVGKAAQAIKGGRAATVAAKGAFAGAEAGILQGAGSALQEKGSTLGDVTKGAAFGALGGAAAGGVFGGIGGQLGKLGGRGRQNAAINSNMKGLSEIENANAPLRRYVAEQQTRGFDVKKDIASTDLLNGAVDKEGVIRTSDSIAQYQKALEGKEGVIRKVLEKEGSTVKADELEKMMLDSIHKRGLKGAAKKRAQTEARQDIEAYIEEAGSTDIPLTLVHDAKVDKYSNLDYSKEESKKAGKAIAKALKRAVEKNTRSIEVQEVNKELSRHFANIGFLEKLDGKRVLGGRLGKYFAQTIGGIAGSHLGPLGTIVGADVAGRVMGRNLAGQFGGKTGGLIPQASSAMKQAIRVGEGLERRLPVKSKPSEFTDELPTIEFDRPNASKKKKMAGLPTIRIR